ncbi:MAG: hypothetical protein DELT_02767 [Desulfovibrio sp.]
MSHNAQAPDTNHPSFTLLAEGGATSFALAGEWTALCLSVVEKRFAEAAPSLAKGGIVDLSNLARLDTSGALFIHTAVKDKNPSYIYADDEQAKLMETASKADISGSAPQPRVSALMHMICHTGRTIVEESKTGVNMVAFLGEYLATCFKLLRNPRQFPVTSLVYHMEQVGASAVPIVALLSFLIGIVIAYMSAQQLAMFGAEIFVVNLIEIVTLRELAVLMTSIVIAGRSGSSFTAQIGAMVSNEEVAAMRTLGLSPMMRLAFPRITALALMLPALVFLADIMGILGGGVAAWTVMGMSPAAFAARFQEVATLKNFLVGLCKAPFFAVVIGVIGCFQGFQVTGSAESVGKLTTRSVVEGIFMVILLDALFAMFFMGLNI